MSSSNKKTFKTSETSKQAGDTVTSDAISLDPSTKEHILVTTVDSSANLSGQVDIELEMSPDGQNWCPAQVKTTTTTSGETTEAIVGNEKAVDLSGDTRNKFARGRLEYNLSDGLDYSGNYPLQERARKDGSDFVHHMIAVNKSFNYSGWYNSDVQPSSTYTPVLFRNGGIDDFENIKAVELTDVLGAGTVVNTQNPFAEKWNFSTFVLEGITPFDDYTIAYWYDSSYALGPEYYHVDQSLKGIGFYDNPSAANLFLGLNYYSYSNEGGTSTLFNSAYSNAPYTPIDGTSSYLIIKRHKLNGDGTATATANVFRDDGTAMVLDGLSNTQYSFTYNVGTAYTTAADGSAAASGSNIARMDEFIIIGDYVSDANLSTLYSTTATGINAVDASTLPDIQAWYRFGDNGTDTKAAISNNITASGRTNQFPGASNSSFTSSDAIPTLSTSHALYSAGPQKTTQNLCNGMGAIENGNAVETSSVGTGAPRGGIIQDDSTFDLTTNLWSVGVWFKCNTNVGTGNPVPSTGSVSQQALMTSYGVSSNFFGGLAAYFAGTDFRVGWFAGGSAFQFKWATLSTDPGASILDGNWHHLLVCKNTTSQDISSNIGLRFFIDGSEITGYSLAGTLTTTSAIFDKATIGYGNISNAAYNHFTHASIGSFLSIGKMDNACFWKSDQSANALTIYNSGKPQTNPTGSPHSHLRFEDSNDLALNSVTGATVSLDTAAAAASWLVQQSSLANTESIYVSASPSLNNLFTTSSNLSISGWFKTTADATGTLFSNTEGAAITGMIMQVTSNTMVLTLNDGSTIQTITANVDVNDGTNWHHVLLTKNDSGTNQFTIYVDGEQIAQSSVSITDAHLKGTNGFTLLSDGENNANAINPAPTDISKLNASLSNWSIHSEVLDQYAAKQLYSNGHVRNIKNLPSVTPANIEAWWQLNDATNPQNDLVGFNHLQYQDDSGQDLANTKNIKGPCILDYGVYEEQNNGGLLSPNLNFYNHGSANSYQTYNFWVYYPSNASGSSALLGDYVSTSGGYFFWATNGTSGLPNLCFLTNSSYNTQFIGINLASQYRDTWTMITFVTDPTFSNSKFYINGQKVENLDDPNNPKAYDGIGTGVAYLFGSNSAITNSGFLCARTYGGAFYNEAYTTYAPFSPTDYGIDEYTAWDKGLSDAEVQELYDDNNYAIHSASADLYRWIRFGDGANDSESSLQCQIDSTFVLDKDTGVTATYSATLTSSDSIYKSATAAPLSTTVVPATGATLIQDTINGNGMTLSLTKNFDFVSESWVTDASGDAAFCLSFNGFESQAEYFALWKCHQTKDNYDVNFLDGNWHNIVLSYRNTTEGSNVKFGPYTATGIGAAFNWNLSMDGIELNDQNSSIGVDYIGGLNSFLAHNNVNIGFPIYNRHLKYVGSTEEKYLAHTQGGATNIYEDTSVGVTQDNPYGFILQPPISTDTPWTFQGLIDETSFHSQDFWTSSGGSDPTNFESEYPATIYGNTNGLSGTRGIGATYATGIPYPLNDPSAIGANPGTSQYINPDRYDASTNPGGGLEAWWRWGDTDTDCGENINDVKDRADGVPNHHIRAVSIDTQDLHFLDTAPDSTYLANQEATTTQGSAITEFVSVVMSNIVDTACNVKDLAQPILQYLRVKITGTGSVDLGKGKAETSIYFTKRRKK